MSTVYRHKRGARMVRFSALCILIMGGLASRSHAQGVLIPGGGAIHRAMAGVSTATPVDAIGAVYWNPAAPSRLSSDQFGVGGEMMIPDIDVSSSVPGGASGVTRSDNGLGMISDLGLVYHLNDRLTASMGLLTNAGGGVTFPGDPSNPILSPTGPFGNVVLGPIHSSMTIVQVVPNASMQLTDKLVVGAGPTVSAAIVSFTPAYFGGLNDANGDGLFSFPDGSNTRPYWGGGFRAGAVYSLTQKIDLGFSYSSPTWFETWKFYSSNEVGQPVTLTLNANCPAIYSWGIAYQPVDRLLLATDLRYIDYKNTDLFGEKIVDSGLNWDSVFAAAFGSRYQLNQRLALMAGYLYNENPVPTVGTVFNVQAPGVTKHSVSCGVSADLTDSITVAMAYIHAFRNTVSGEPAEAIGANVIVGAAVDSIAITINIKFGDKPERGGAPVIWESASPEPVTSTTLEAESSTTTQTVLPSG
ncbi:MAG: outer membrane protein transport protein [Planctomycetota bacterium]